MKDKPLDLTVRTKSFAYHCISFALALPKNHALADVIRRQLIRSASSVAANYRAAFIAPTRKMFGSKLSICAEEADESNFWLEMAFDYELGQLDKAYHEMQEATELTKIFIASRKTVSMKDKPF